MTLGAIRDAAARLLSILLPRGLMRDKRYFALWEARGYHVTPVHFYEPIPDTRTLTENLWSQRSRLVGVELNEDGQLKLLATFTERFKREYDRFPRTQTSQRHEYYLDNGFFGSVDAEVLWSMVRHFKPRRVIEVGSGYSTCLLAQAILRNGVEDPDHACEFIAIDPDPPPFLTPGQPGLSRLVPARVQDVPLAEFERLGPNDILFIDSSHVLAIGSDVQYEYLEVLPRLNVGVVVHVHDILLPAEYKRQTVLDKHRFWTEQYLLQAFLTFNERFEVLWASHAMHLARPDLLQTAFASYRRDAPPPVSFWMRRLR